MNWTNVRVKLGDLKAWEHNPRLSTTAQAKRLLQSFDEFGQVETIAVSPEMDVYNGHQRLSALLTVHGKDYEIDARQADRLLTEDERKKLTVFLHAGAVGSWDWDTLSGWDAQEVISWGMDDSALKDWKRDVTALDSLLKSEEAEPADAEPQIDRAAELNEKWQVETGDLWQIGDHRLLCGDSTKREDVERVAFDCDSCITDPPYGQNQNGVTDDEPEKQDKIISGFVSALPKSIAGMIAFQSPRTFITLLDYARKLEFTLERMLWLYKAAQCTFPWRGWILKSESILIMSRNGFDGWNEVHPYSHDCYYLSEVSGELDKNSGWHGSVKPLSVVQDLVSRFGNIVLDPFAGSGTTMIACENLHRKCRGIEISPNYCAVILERMSTAFPELEIMRL